MAMFLRKSGAVYFPVPKVASTSIKHFLFEVENGFEFRHFVLNNKVYYIYDFVQNVKFDRNIEEVVTNMYGMCIVRDPIERLVSAYKNRVFREHMLSKGCLSKRAIRAGVVPYPDFQTFCDRMTLYRKYSEDIRLHTEPMCCFLGKRPEIFKEIFNIGELGRFQDKINAMSGTECVLPRIHQTSNMRNSIDIGGLSKSYIRKFYEIDYDIYGKFL
jgi:hypothetical protein